jgi:phage tail-like protein
MPISPAFPRASSGYNAHGDKISSHNFKVEFGSKAIPSVHKVSDVSDETDTVSWGEGALPVGTKLERHGLTKTNNIRLERYFDPNDKTLRNMWKEVRDGKKVEDLHQPLAIQLIGDDVRANKVALEVVLQNAWMCKYGISEFDAKSKSPLTEYAEFAGEYLDFKKGA